jgi:hypothetical protein
MKSVDSNLMKSGELALLKVAECWELTDAELSQLFSPRESDHECALQYGLDTDDVTAIRALRISSLLGIYRALAILFPDSAQAFRWISRPNSRPPFSGSTALGYMIRGGLRAIIEVRRLLDAELV